MSGLLNTGINGFNSLSVNQYVINALSNLSKSYQSMVAYFYQRISQSQFSNNTLAKYDIDYSLLLPNSQNIYNLNPAQVNAQIQVYIDECDILIEYVRENVTTQVNLFYEQIQNILNNTITQANGFAQSLLTAQYQALMTYTVPYSMGMTTAMFLNNISLDTYSKQITLNSTVLDFNNLMQGSVINLMKI